VKQVWLLLLAFCSLALAQTVVLPPPLTWGDYTVKLESAPQGTLLRIIRDGRTQVEIKGNRFTYKLVELTGKEPFELWVNEFSGGEGCCNTAYFFTQEDGFRNLLIYRGKGAGVVDIRDINEDKRPEIYIGTDSFSGFGDLPLSVYPRLNYILSWDGVRYVNVTSRYPTLGRYTLSFYRDALTEAVAQNDLINAKSAALGYYVRGLMIGQGLETKAWVLENAPPEVRKWLLDQEGAIIAVLYRDLGCRLTVSYSRQLPPQATCRE
jgi:hypothetical protein